MDLKVKNYENLIRDSVTGAIINIDEEENIKYRKRKLDKLREKQKEKEFQTLKNEVKMMKSLLLELYEKIVNDK